MSDDHGLGEEAYGELREHQLMFAAACKAGLGEDTREGALKREMELLSDREEAERVGQVVHDEDGHVEEYLDPRLDASSSNHVQGYAIYVDMCREAGLDPLAREKLFSK